ADAMLVGQRGHHGGTYRRRRDIRRTPRIRRVVIAGFQNDCRRALSVALEIQVPPVANLDRAGEVTPAARAGAAARRVGAAPHQPKQQRSKQNLTDATNRLHSAILRVPSALGSDWPRRCAEHSDPTPWEMMQA